MDGVNGRWVASVLAILNAGLLLYAIHHFIGFPESIDDLTFRMAPQSHRLDALTHSETVIIGGSPTGVAVANGAVPLTRNE
jgi:hypothetical protein